MYRPFQVYLEKKFGKSELGVKHEDDEAVEEWKSLSNKKRLKFVRKAEKKYDNSTDDDNKQPFHSYLTFQELELLLKSYNMPERPPPNSKIYTITKYKSLKNGETNEAQLNNEAVEHWTNLGNEEKKKILDEFHQIVDNYEDEYVDFLRGLPEQRVTDLKHYLLIRKNLARSRLDESNDLPTNGRKNKSLKKTFKMFVPYEIYFVKMKGKSSDGVSINRVSSRSAYTALSAKKKLKYIKQAEENYDSYDFNRESLKPRFSFFLSKSETEILLKSYGMPDLVPNGLPAFVVKKLSKINGNSMKKLFEIYKKYDADEKEKLRDEYKQAKQEFDEATQVFLEKLPQNRADDYLYFRNKSQKRIAQAAYENGNGLSSGTPAKKMKIKI